MAELWNTFNQKTKRSNINYGELPEYNTVFRGGIAQETTRNLVCKWYDRWNFQQDLLMAQTVGTALPNNVIVSKVGAQNIVSANRLIFNRLDPEPHPKYPHLYASYTEEIRGLGSPSTDPATNALYFNAGINQTLQGYAHVKTVYKPLPFTLTPHGQTEQTINNVPAPLSNPRTPVDAAQADLITEACRYVSVHPKGSTSNFPIPNGVFRQSIDFHDGKGFAQIPEGGTISLPRVHLAYTWYAVPFVPELALSAMGCVNCNYFDIVQRAAPYSGVKFFPGTILYTYPEISDFYPLADGTKVVDVVYHLVYNPLGWNRVYSPARGGFVPCFRNAPNLVIVGGAMANDAIEIPNAGGAGGAPVSDAPYYRYPPGYSLYDWIDLNLLFCLLQ